MNPMDEETSGTFDAEPRPDKGGQGPMVSVVSTTQLRSRDAPPMSWKDHEAALTKKLSALYASMDTDGLVKVLAHAETDEVLGVHMCGPRAADMIAEAVVAMEFRVSAEDIARMSHAHPTFTEAIKEAALAATEDRALHI